MDDTHSNTDRPAQPVVVTKPGHPISRRDVDPDALKIIYRLHGLGFTAYLTGGAVRDLMLGRPAKDFDVVTDARPGQIKKRFARAFIIGRRFRLAHVHFGGGKYIEVATFRRISDQAARETPAEESAPAHPYGTAEEDAFRRDITINALYYDVINDAVIDYVGGLEDIARRTVRVIGNPAERFTEDPVRIWRVLRYAARLGFAVDEAAEREIPGHAHLIAVSSGARLYEELNKDLAFETRPVMETLRKYGILRYIFGKVGEAWEADAELFSRLSSLLDIVDRTRTAGSLLTIEEMYAVLFWPWLEPLLEASGVDYHKVLSDSFRDAGMRVSIPRNLRADSSQVLIIVAAMDRALRTGRVRWSLLQRPHFGPAQRLYFLFFKGRLPEKDESFEALFRQAFPVGGKGIKRRRRRRSRRARPRPDQE
jgi:poly(A) polymerase